MTQGYPVRAFSYDGAGRMIEARVFTQTTEFAYNGLGARLAVSVAGYGTTRYTLDYAAGNRILSETTPTETVRYLYGHDCLGEQRDAEWLYYLPDAEGYVRQGTDADGDLVSAWLFDPDGTVLEGPNGPVSHLICGGVYDWSTGLLHKNGGYFDPRLGIWLALAPLVVIQARRRGKRKEWLWAIGLTMFFVGTSGLLTGCEDYDKFAKEFVCTDIPEVFQEKPAGECKVESVYRRPPQMIATASEPDTGFYLDKWIVFCLEEDIDAERDCKVGSWTKGYMRSRSTSETSWRYPQGKVFRDVFPDFPEAGVDYNGSNPKLLKELPADCLTCSHQRIVFHDNPGYHALILPEPAIYEVSHQFWTVLYDGSEGRAPDGQDWTPQEWTGMRDGLQPVWVETWFFDSRAEVDATGTISVAYANY